MFNNEDPSDFIQLDSTLKKPIDNDPELYYEGQ